MANIDTHVGAREPSRMNHSPSRFALVETPANGAVPLALMKTA